MAFYALLLNVMRGEKFLGGSFSGDAGSKKRGSIIAIVISLIAVIGIPNQAVIFLVNEFSFIFFIILTAGVPAALLFTSKKEDRKKRGLLLIVTGIMFWVLATVVSRGWGLGTSRAFEDLLTWFYFGGTIMVIAGVSMLLGNVNGEKIIDRLTGKKPDETKPETKEEKEEDEVDELPKDLKQLHDLLDKTKRELRSYGLLAKEEIEKITIITENISLNLKALSRRETGTEKVLMLLLENLNDFKKYLAKVDKNTWRGTRYLLRFGRREEGKIPEIEKIINKLKNRNDPKLQNIIQNTEEIFHYLDQLIARVQEIRKEMGQEHSDDKEIDHELAQVEKEIANLEQSMADKSKEGKEIHVNKLIEHLKTLTTELEHLVKLLEISYTQIRDAYQVSMNIEKKVDEVVNLISQV